MPSSPDNVDMQRLRRDIPRFLNSSRVITEVQKEWWENLFKDADVIYNREPNKPSSWLLDDVRVIKARNHVLEKQSNTHHSRAENNIPPAVDHEALEMVNEQLEDIPEVSIINYLLK